MSTNNKILYIGVVGTSKNIVCKRKTTEELDSVLKQLVEQHGKDFELVVVSGGGLIATCAFNVAKKYKLKGVFKYLLVSF